MYITFVIYIIQKEPKDLNLLIQVPIS